MEGISLWDQGYQAASEGKNLEDSPYNKFTQEYIDWAEGWWVYFYEEPYNEELWS